MNIKKSKPIYTLDMYCGKKKCDPKERKLSVDLEHKPFVRGKRRRPNLPCSYDTKWLTKYKSWKHRVKKRFQWMLHKKNDNEQLILCNFNYSEKYLLYLYGNKKWNRINETHYYDVLKLVNDKKLLGKFNNKNKLLMVKNINI